MGDAVSELGEAGRGKGYYNLEETLGAQDGTSWMGWNDKRATARPWDTPGVGVAGPPGEWERTFCHPLTGFPGRQEAWITLGLQGPGRHLKGSHPRDIDPCFESGLEAGSR